MTLASIPAADAADLADGGPDDVAALLQPGAAWTDDELAATVAAVVAVPRAAPADSFVLHAPLELLARVTLLRRLPPRERLAARQRLVQLAIDYAAAGDPVERRPRPIATTTAAGAAERLAAAIAAGDVDDVDDAATALAELAGAAELAGLLADPVVTSLAAAAHASILLDLLPRTTLTTALVRGPARELARHADWRLQWFEDPGRPPSSPAHWPRRCSTCRCSASPAARSSSR